MSVLPRRLALVRAADWLYPSLALALTLFAVAPLTYPGFFQSHTGYRAVYNLIDLHSSVNGLSWAPMWGAGYDLFRMDGPLGYWLAELLYLVGVPFTDAIKLVYGVAFVTGALGMYALVRRVYASEAAGLLAAVVYVYFPYHLAVVYIRGAFGEALAWGLMPWTLLALMPLPGVDSAGGAGVALPYRTRRSSRVLAATSGAVGMMLLVLAQPGLAVVFAVVAVAWCIIAVSAPAYERRAFRLWAVLAAAVGLAVGLLLLVPALVRQNRALDPNGFVAAFVEPFQLFSATWGSEIPSGGFLDQFAFQMGIAALGLTILAVALARRARQTPEYPRVKRVMVFSLVTVGVLLLLMLPFAAPVWSLGLSVLARYPFQLLTLIGFLLAIVVGSVSVSEARLAEIPLLAALTIIPILAVYPYLKPEFLDFSPTKPALARFNNDEVALLDAKVVRPPGVWRHGATVQLDLIWQALRQPNRDYTVFVHVVDEAGKQWGGVDEKPAGGALSTLKWAPGRVFTDTHSVQINLEGPPEGYHIELGLYPAATGERALTESGADHIRIEENKE